MGFQCVCNASASNMGNPNCPDVFQIARKFIFVPLFGSNGQRTKLPISSLATLASLPLEAENPLDRFFPTAEVENVEDTRDEPVRQEFNSGKSVQVRDGFRNNVAYIPNGGTIALGKYESWGCTKFGVYILDDAGNLIYMSDPNDPTNAYPIIVDNDTYYAGLTKPTNSEVQMIMLMWQWAKSQKDKNLRYVSFEELDYDSDDLQGLFDASATYSNSTVNGITVKIETEYGVPVSGLVSSDFVSSDSGATDSVYNVTQDADVALTTVTENPAGSGSYDLVYAAAQTIGDSIRVKNPINNGVDFAEIWNGENDAIVA